MQRHWTLATTQKRSRSLASRKTAKTIMMKMMRLATAVLLWAASTSAFLSSPSPVRSNLHKLMVTTKEPPAMPPIKDISYGEGSRKFRRTVYTHDDWRKHRSPDRFFYYLQSTFSSGVYKNLLREVGSTTAVATFVVAWNMLTGGYTDFDNVKHAALIQNQFLPILSLPLSPFTLSSPSLGLLLGMWRCYVCYYLVHRNPLSHIFVQCFEPTHPTNVGTKLEKTGV